MALDTSKLPSNILRDLIERGFNTEQIAQMSPKEAFDEYLQWNGIINYTNQLWTACLVLQAAKVD